MNTWRSSSMYTWVRTGCAATIILEREGVPKNLQMFAVGEVAHLLLDAAAKWNAEDPHLFGKARAKKLHALAYSYLDHMPAWECQPKPPVGPDQAAEGLRLALAWIERHGVPEGQSEIGLAVGADLKTAVPYGSPDARWEGLVDSIARYDDFDELTGMDLDVVRVDDYKTAWGDKEAKTLQRKGQAILTVAHVGKTPSRLILRTLNLRRLDEFAFVSDDVEDDLTAWRAELSLVLEEADKALEKQTVESAARPGPRCMKCQYLAHCEAGQRYSGDAAAPNAFAGLVGKWGTTKATEEMLFAQVSALLDGAGGIARTGDGEVVRRGTRERRVLRSSIAHDLWARWFTGSGDPAAAAVGLLARLGIKPSNIDAFIRSTDPMERGPWRDWFRKRVDVVSEPHGVVVEDEQSASAGQSARRPQIPKVVAKKEKKRKKADHGRDRWTAPLETLTLGGPKS